MKYSMESVFTMLMDLYYSYNGGDNSSFFTQIPYELSKAPSFYLELEEDLSLIDTQEWLGISTINFKN